MTKNNTRGSTIIAAPGYCSSECLLLASLNMRSLLLRKNHHTSCMDLLKLKYLKIKTQVFGATEVGDQLAMVSLSIDLQLQ